MDEVLAHPYVKEVLLALDRFQIVFFEAIQTISSPSDIPKVIATNLYRLDYSAWIIIAVILYVATWILFAILTSMVRSVLWAFKLAVYLAIFASIAYFALQNQDAIQRVIKQFDKSKS
ncbi:hypothetical protein HDV05_008010 [Chytridiales sp. JEL 0842]|nr:hypothetical protein HDV05_008010 [Chytridiales sp. JEL 0842]